MSPLPFAGKNFVESFLVSILECVKQVITFTLMICSLKTLISYR